MGQNTWHNLEADNSAASEDSSLKNLLSQIPRFGFNLEADNSHPIITEGDGDINVTEGHGDVQMTHGGDIVATNKRGPRPTPTPKKHFHIDTDRLRGLTGKPSK